MKFSILSIGTELNLGLILNTNSQYIADSLTEIGLECNYMITVRDNETDIAEALHICENISDIVVICGGLGPTDDDLTRNAFAVFSGGSLVRKKSLDNSSTRFLRYIKNDSLKENLIRQSYIPENSAAIRPRIGSASGFIYRRKGKIFFSIPGVPREMKDMFNSDVVPAIREFLEEKETGGGRSEILEPVQFIKKEILFATDISESQLEFSIRSIKPLASKLGTDLGVTANPGLIKIMLISKGKDLKDCDAKLSILRQEILYLIGDHVYMCGEGTIGDSIKNAILACGTKLTICTAESITGGLISSLITDTPGSSEYFLGSVISYSSTVKENLLGVDRALIEKKGAVSAGVCTQMAKNARSIFKSDFAVSATGFAGPTVNEEGKFVGLVYTCIAGPDSSIELHEKSFIGTRADIKFRTAQFILNRLRLLIGNIK